ncbi:hypothetical protein VS868_06280 [Salinimicrobium sp. 3283s]|uniref:hypothetical protein n=1 Tax=Flavobacteriaceae TaxID=49546 RepID=UPI001F2EFCCC|nr:hypothetical protein [Antarcticibacterium sp. 1MA-6-2]UJH91916.1 hypothetical protein LZ575_04535 [Antarcticibacterium sp. 1MA-6-2]
MTVDPKARRKTKKIKYKKSPKSKITRKDRINGILMLIGVFVLAFLFFWFVLKNLHG